ncbi:ABC transporter substrate-binding protein [Methanofollis ethanolicus]|uniref:ABC transporter substrate-binding protein n=1 Tax=Methanofollis ethanolicus TaxID=488124 RepID=UPI00082A9981|nr:ABC transporter substrate-binding protein [Methanofollis ethanolicus]
MRSVPVAVFLLLLVTPSLAALPCDGNGDDVLSEGEFVSAAFAYLDTEYRNGTGQAPPRDDLADAAFVYYYWGGRPWTWAGVAGSTPSSFDRPVRRAAVMHPSVLETLRSIGYPTENVVGIDSATAQASAFFPEMAGRAVVGSPEHPDTAALLSLAPDAVFVEAGAGGDRAAQAISEAGLPVVRVACSSPASYLGDVRALGDLLGLNDGAAALSRFIDEEEERVRACLAGLHPREAPVVYAEDVVDYTACGEGTPLCEEVKAAGGRPAFSGTEKVSDTAVLAVDPEYVVKRVGSEPYLMGGYGDRIPVRFIEVRNAIGRRPGWSGTRAVKAGQVFVVHTSLVEGPQYFIGRQYLASWFHPDLCADLDPAAIQAEYFSRFQGLPGSAGIYVSGGVR